MPVVDIQTSFLLALDELEVLRDGTPPKLTLINRFYETTPILSNYKSFFFEVIHSGKKAGVSCQMAMLTVEISLIMSRRPEVL